MIGYNSKKQLINMSWVVSEIWTMWFNNPKYKSNIDFWNLQVSEPMVSELDPQT